MNDYLEIYKKFKDVKEIVDYIDDVEKLRYYYGQGLYNEMQQHINSLTNKYILETLAWNSVNNDMPTTYQQAYINAENFLQAKGATLIVEKVKNYKFQLSASEVAYIESTIKPME